MLHGITEEGNCRNFAQSRVIDTADRIQCILHKISLVHRCWQRVSVDAGDVNRTFFVKAKTNTVL